LERWAELEAVLKQKIKGPRLEHIYRVVDTARELARLYGAPALQTEVAALMHDYAKHMSAEQLLEYGRSHGLIVDPLEVDQPHLLHGAVAAVLLKEQGLVTDQTELDAIRWHTTGRPGMGLVEKIIWVADFIEPGRKFPGVDEIRTLARWDLDRALLMALDSTIRHVINQGFLLHLYSVQARNWLITTIAGRTLPPG
jgi:predicted HD superfamily hydrolase involved in NAD metabolism